MSKKQFSALFLCSLVPFAIGNGMTPLMSVYVIQLGADPAVAGYYLSFSQFALTAGTLAAGWLSDRLQRRKTLIIAGGLLTVPAIWLMSRATSIWYLAPLSAVFYFWGGMAVTLTSILAGLFADKAVRGRVFGFLALTPSLGALMGGLATGRIADRWGYPTLFVVLSLFGIIWPLAGLFLKDKAVARAERGGRSAAAGQKAGLGRSFHLLFLASLVAVTASYVSRLGAWLVMNDLGFAAAAISSTVAVGGAAALPLL